MGVAGSDAARLSKPSFFAGRRLGVHHQTVQRCVERERWPMARLRHLMTDRDRAKSRRSRRRPRPGWYLGLRDKAKEHGYPHELWTTRLLARRARARTGGGSPMSWPVWLKAPCASFSVKRKSSRTRCATIWKRRDAEFEPKMAEVLCVYREVQVLKKPLPRRRNRRSRSRSSLTTRSLNPGHRHDGTGFAASASTPCELRAGS